MTEREYNEHPGVRRSDLWKMSESPEKYLWAKEHPIEPTPAMLFGSAAHKFILETDDFEKEYAVAPNVDRRTKAGKEAWDNFMNYANGRTVITEDVAEVIEAMDKALEKVPMTQELLYGKGETEVPFFWADKDTGELCKVKLDRLVKIDGRYVVVDYKTAKCARTDRFSYDIVKLGYHLQAAMYTEAVMVCCGLDYRPDFIFIVQEKDEPYSVNIVTVPADSSVMLHGVDTFRELIGMLHQCKELENWPGYLGVFGEPNEAVLPGWISLAEEE